MLRPDCGSTTVHPLSQKTCGCRNDRCLLFLDPVARCSGLSGFGLGNSLLLMPFRAPLVLALLVSLSESLLDSLSLRRRSDIGRFGEGEQEGDRPPKPPPEEPGMEKSKSEQE